MTDVARFSAVDEVVEDVRRKLSDEPVLQRMFSQCFVNTLETTARVLDDGTAFVLTGDIPAMWLRDSSAQVRPYVPLARRDRELRRVIRGLVRRQAQCILLDAYANAFNLEPVGQQHDDRPAASPWVWERKFELDSLCYPVQLLHDYWRATDDTSVFDETVHAALQRIVQVMRIEQHHESDSDYTFQRAHPHLPTDTLPREGAGTPVAFTGMVWSGFRPSDDACTYGYLVPANMFACVVLRFIGRFACDFYGDDALAAQADELRNQIEHGIETHGMVEHPRYGWIYAYETDGLGSHLVMDDANVPSLLSIPYLGYRQAGNPVYRNTRAFVLSNANPYYHSGRFARGVGSPHTPPGRIWHIAMCTCGLTSTDSDERDEMVRMLADTTAGTDYMHESFDPNDPSVYSRPWFAWANSLFAELVLKWVGGAPAETVRE
jgi:meiotically up-regulated gene 157 (Mug157) protein